MSQPATHLHLSQPCAESWAAMTPTSGGRHCAACQKTVLDFTWHTDAELLAFFQQAGAGGTCGRFRASQVGRPLRPAAPPASPASRWRAGLAAAFALWSLRAEAASPPLPAALPRSAQHPRRRPAPARPTRQVAHRVVSGVVRDASTDVALPHVRVYVPGTRLAAHTDKNGYFRLRLPVRRGPHAAHELVLHLRNYHDRPVRVPLAARPARALRLILNKQEEAPDLTTLSGGVDGLRVEEVTPPPPAPPAASLPAGRPRRSFFQWLTQPFRAHAAK